jgi:hypothetical protein
MPAAPLASAQARFAAQRQELQRRDPIDLDVPGYANLVARYTALSYRQERRLYGRQSTNRDEVEAEVLFATDALVNACDALLERRNGVLVDLGEERGSAYKWGPDAARDLFGAELQTPDGKQPTARQAMAEIFPDDRLLMRHFVELEQRSDRVNAKVDQELPGESDAGLTPA